MPRPTTPRERTAARAQATEGTAVPATAAEAEPGSARLGRWAAWALFLAGLLVIVRMTSWYPDQYNWTVYALILGPGVRGMLAISAGILILAPRVRPEVALGYLTAVTVAGGLGALSAVAAGVDFGVDRMEVWWALALVGQTLIAVTGVLVISIAAWRSPLPRESIAWRDPATVAVLVAGGATVLLLVLLAGVVSSMDSSSEAITYMWAGATVGLVFVALGARPSAAGRVMLLAWAVAVAGFALSSWVYMTNNSREWAGMTWLVLSSIALAVAGGFIGRRREQDS